MPRRKTHEEFIAEVKELVGDEFTVLGNYVNNSTKTLMRHNTCNHTWEVSPVSFLKSKGCPKCAGNIKKTTEQFKKEVYDLESDNYTVLSEYKNANTKVSMRHNDCGHEYLVAPSHFLSGKRCPKCQKVYRLNHDEFVKEVFNLVKNEYTVLSEFKNTKAKIKVIHNTCGHVWNIQAGAFLRGTRCPECRKKYRHNSWASYEDDIVIENYPNQDRDVILNKLNNKRTWESVIFRARKLGVSREIHQTKESLINAYWDIYYENNRFPTSYDFSPKKNNPSMNTIRRLFGSWLTFLKEVGVVDSKNTDGWLISDEALLRKYYHSGNIDEIQKQLSTLRGKHTIAIKANSLGLSVDKSIKYKKKYKDNKDVIHKIKKEALYFYKNNNKTPSIKDLTCVKNPRNAIESNWNSYNDFLRELNIPISRRDETYIDKDEILHLASLYFKENKELPTLHNMIDLGMSNLYMTKHFGTFSNLLYSAGLIDRIESDPNYKLDKSVEGLKYLYKMLGRVPTHDEYKEYARKNKLYNPYILEEKVVGNNSYHDLCVKVLNDSTKNNISKDELVNLLLNLKNKLGRSPMAIELEKYGLPNKNIYITAFKMPFNDILKSLSLEPFKHDPKYKSDEELLNDFNALYRKLNRPPLRIDIENADNMCGYDVYINRFDSIKNVYDKLDIITKSYVTNISTGYGNICFDLNGERCNSIHEMVISNIFIKSNIKTIKEYPYSKFNKNDKRRFDWYLPEYNLYVEYFGLAYKKVNNGVIKEYTKKTLSKIEFCKNKNIKLISIFKDDTKHDYNGMINKFKEQGINLKI